MTLILANIARVTRTFAMAIWVGGLIFFVVVAAVAFGNLPSTHEAGLVVRGSLIAVHRIGMGSAGIFALATTLLNLLSRQDQRKRFLEVILVVIMFGLTYYSQFKIIPTMESDRIALFQQYGTEVDATPKTAPAHADFDRLHNVSTKVEGTVLLLGLVVLGLGAIKTRSEAA